MVFSSIFFLLYFLPVFLLINHVVQHKHRNYVLLLGSIFFYSWGAPVFVVVLLLSTILDFFIVKKIYSSDNEITRKLYLALSISVNLGLLAYFKYANFFVENLNELLSFFNMKDIKWIGVALPIGISFYTFQTLTYSIDVYRRKHEPLNRISDYVMYIMSFPQLIAGPIVRFNEIADQIINRKESIDDKFYGAFRFSIGLFKKVLIANIFSEQTEIIFSEGINNMNFWSAWLGIISYTFQIYFDFSGYSDMAIGLGKIMGFTFPENFNRPYLSKSISEFWRRWHITLGNFMKDYLYIPLGGNRVNSTAKLYFNLCIVFLLSGLWHGASWNFVIWGGYHGFLLILDRLFLIKIMEKSGKTISTIITFFLIVLGWAIFKIEDLHELSLFFKTLFSFNLNGSVNFISTFIPVLTLAITISFIVPKNALVNRLMQNSNLIYKLISLAGIGVMFLLSVTWIASSGFNPFIYFRF